MNDARSPTHIGDYLAQTQKKIRLQPRFTVIHHPVRTKFELSFSAYT